MKAKAFLIMVIIPILLLACKTVPEETISDYSGEPVLIQVRAPGISPAKDSLFDTVEFGILAGKNFTPERWALDILNESGSSIKDTAGSGQAPSIWAWDGMDKGGKKAADGRYLARLSVWFPGAVDPLIHETSYFVVDGTGPVGTVTFSEGLFSPDDDGVNDFLDIEVSVVDELSDVASWVLNIYDSHGGELVNFYSDREPSGSMTWDGMKNGALAVSSASDYEAVLTSRDSLGNVAIARSEFSTDILVIRDDDSIRIRVNSISFKAFSADFMDVERDQKESNIETLDLLASKLKKFPGYKITLEGHAVSVFWDKPAKALKENNEVLIPLSEARAQAIKDALLERGLKAESMNVMGLGANRPLIPFSDLQNRWKNRRVVFILEK